MVMVDEWPKPKIKIVGSCEPYEEEDKEYWLLYIEEDIPEVAPYYIILREVARIHTCKKEINGDEEE